MTDLERLGPRNRPVDTTGTDKAEDTPKEVAKTEAPRARIILPSDSDFETKREEGPKGPSSSSSEKRASELGGKTGSTQGESSIRSSSFRFTSSKSALEAVTLEGPIAAGGRFKTPNSPKLFAGVKIVVAGDDDKPARTGTLVGYNTRGQALVRSSSGEFTARNDITVPAGQSYRSPLDSLSAAQIYRPSPAEKAKLDALLDEKASYSSKVKDYVDVIHDSGFEAYVVGGAVRDIFTGDKPRDVDLSTSMWVGDLSDALRPTKLSGGTTRSEYGTMLVGGSDGLDICSLKAGKGEFGFDLQEDIKIRDFTINSLFYDPANGVVADPTGRGVQDAKDKILRASAAPGQEERWLRDNPSAALRLFKFTLRGYTPDPKLVDLIKQNFKRSLDSMNSFRVTAMKRSIGASPDEVRTEMTRLGFSDAQIEMAFPKPKPIFRRRDDDDDDRPSFRSSGPSRSDGPNRGGPNRGGPNRGGGSSSSDGPSRPSWFSRVFLGATDTPNRTPSDSGPSSNSRPSNDGPSTTASGGTWVETGPGRSRLVMPRDSNTGNGDAPSMRSTSTSSYREDRLREFAKSIDCQIGRPNNGARTLAVARGHLGHVSMFENGARNDLEKAGFDKVGERHYAHADGSWVRFAGGNVYRGHKNILFTEIPDGPGPR